MENPLLRSGQINYLTMTASGEGTGIITGVRPAPWVCNFHPFLDILTSVVCAVMTWFAFRMLFNMDSDPYLASVVMLVLSSWACGKLAGLIYLPPLLGMFLAGVVLRNTGHYDVDLRENVFQNHIRNLREVALVILLVASGISLDASMLKKLSFVVFQLAILPCITETVAAAVVTHYVLGFPWMWGILLGCILSPVSSAVILPALLEYKQKGLDKEKGIITLVMAACSFDDIFAISAFGVCLSIIFSKGDWQTDAMKGPTEVIMGLGAGVICGLAVGYIPHKCETNLTTKRVYIIIVAGVLMTFGATKIDYSGAGPLAVMTAAFVAAICWKKNDSYSENVESTANDMWDSMEPLLFASIGTEINLSTLDSDLLLWAAVLLSITSMVRVLTVFFVLRNTGFNLSEKIFVNIAWLPKATVQAAIGPIALNYARDRADDSSIQLATQVLAISVLAILVTAPLGAILMKLRGEYLLTKPYL